MSKTEYYRTTITLTILSTRDPSDMDLMYILQESDTGDFVMDDLTSTEVITAKEMAVALSDARSSCEFFDLDEDGNHIDDEEEPGDDEKQE